MPNYFLPAVDYGTMAVYSLGYLLHGNTSLMHRPCRFVDS